MTGDQQDTEQTFVPGMSDAASGETNPTQNAASPTPVGTEPASTTRPSEASNKTKQLGDFTVLKKLGQGGMGEVYLAHQVSLDRKVALKTLSKELSKKEDFVKRFQREARSMAKLDHNNAVKVYAVDSVQGIHFAAIEFIDGKSMQDWMDQLKTLSIGDALHVILACADALKVAHNLKMIHRDIKPDNILVTSNGTVKLADFGLAKALDDEDVSMTQSGTGLGTPLYMAPEQARNAKYVDQRTDIYALGCTLYYFLTGALPFTGSSTLELIMAKEKGIFKNARKINTEIPDRLDLMIDKAIAKDPAHRYADCASFIKDLEDLGLQSPTLSFINHPEKAVRGAGGPASQAFTNQTSAPKKKTSKDARSSASSSAMGNPGTWYLRYPDPSGRIKKAKLTTDAVKQALRKGMIDSRAKACSTSDGEYLPLAQIPVFDSLMQGVVTKQNADKRSKDMKQIYEKLDRQEKNRKRFRFLRNWADGLKGGVGLIVWLAIVAGVGFVAWKFGWPMIQNMMK